MSEFPTTPETQAEIMGRALTEAILNGRAIPHPGGVSWLEAATANDQYKIDDYMAEATVDGKAAMSIEEREQLLRTGRSWITITLPDRTTFNIVAPSAVEPDSMYGFVRQEIEASEYYSGDPDRVVVHELHAHTLVTNPLDDPRLAPIYHRLTSPDGQ